MIFHLSQIFTISPFFYAGCDRPDLGGHLQRLTHPWEWPAVLERLCGAFHSHGGTPFIAGWFISGKIRENPMKLDDNGGSPMT